MFNPDFLAIPTVFILLSCLVLLRRRGKAQNLAGILLQTALPASVLLWVVLYLVFANS